MTASIVETLATLIWIRREQDVGKGKAYKERRYLYVVLEMVGTMH
jgi:hypothetical protein